MNIDGDKTEIVESVTGLMIAVAKRMEREAMMPYLRRRKNPLKPDDIEWNPQLVVFRPEDFIRQAVRASLILVPERFVQHIRVSRRICHYMNWTVYEEHLEMGLLGHFAGSPVYSDHMASAMSRNPKDKFLFVGAKRNG